MQKTQHRDKMTVSYAHCRVDSGGRCPPTSWVTLALRAERRLTAVVVTEAIGPI